MDLKVYLERVMSGGYLTQAECELIGGSLAQGEVDSCQLSALLVLLSSRGERWEELVGFALAMRRVSHTVEVPGRCQEIVGTGGDGQNTVNISTASAVVTAACGVPVAKHGSVSVSSLSGSADVLGELGVAHLPPAAIPACLAQCGVAFMFAPLFHPAMRHVLPVRKALRVRTVFNLLGPLLNPAGAQRLLLGVYSPALLTLYADAVAHLGVERALIVHTPLEGGGGLDELATTGPAMAIEVGPRGFRREFTIDAGEWGVPRCRIEDLVGGSPKDNAAAIRRVLGGGGEDSHVARTVALNSGAALFCFGAVDSIEQGYGVAMQAIKDGKATALLDKWGAYTQQEARLQQQQQQK